MGNDSETIRAPPHFPTDFDEREKDHKKSKTMRELKELKKLTNLERLAQNKVKVINTTRQNTTALTPHEYMRFLSIMYAHFCNRGYSPLDALKIIYFCMLQIRNSVECDGRWIGTNLVGRS